MMGAAPPWSGPAVGRAPTPRKLRLLAAPRGGCPALERSGGGASEASDALEDCGDALAAADAHGHQRIASADALQFV